MTKLNRGIFKKSPLTGNIEYYWDGNYKGRCSICNIQFTSAAHMNGHVQGKKHIKKKHCWRMRGYPDLQNDGNGFFCDVCKCPFPGQESYEEHLVGTKHMKMVGIFNTPNARSSFNTTWPKTISLIQRQNSADVAQKRHDDIATHRPGAGIDLCDDLIDLPASFIEINISTLRKAPIQDHLPSITKYVPPNPKTPLRNYQKELFRKAKKYDTLCFLPTGTGKTLVAVKTICEMLTKFPSKNALFLVDKILLVIQQSKYIKSELQGKLFKRPTERQLRIASLCNGKQDKDGYQLWEQDIIISTADYCCNLLEKKTLRWRDFSIVVFDEAHHCDKEHPFNKLLDSYHKRTLEHQNKPKILGLTASPAGGKSVLQTEQMLKKILSNMGNAQLNLVEKPKNVTTLKRFESNAELVIESPPNTEEISQNKLRHHLNVIFLKCILKLLDISNISKYIEQEQICENLSDSKIRNIADEFVERNLENVERNIDSVKYMLDESNKKSLFSDIVKCVRHVCKAWHDVSTIQAAVDKKKPFECLNDPKIIFEEIVHTEKMAEDEQTYTDPYVQKIILILTDTLKKSSSTEKKPLILVLVGERRKAFWLKKILQNSKKMRQHKLNTTCVVGHGKSGSVAKGMTVTQQRNELEKIKNDEYKVVIATSVAEEGVDWPKCECVVSMYIPNTTTSLVQMRGRARKKHSKFIILCRSSKEENAMKEIMNREKNMKIATRNIIKNSKKQDSLKRKLEDTSLPLEMPIKRARNLVPDPISYFDTSISETKDTMLAHKKHMQDELSSGSSSTNRTDNDDSYLSSSSESNYTSSSSSARSYSKTGNKVTKMRTSSNSDTLSYTESIGDEYWKKNFNLEYSPNNGSHDEAEDAFIISSSVHDSKSRVDITSERCLQVSSSKRSLAKQLCYGSQPEKDISDTTRSIQKSGHRSGKRLRSRTKSRSISNSSSGSDRSWSPTNSRYIKNSSSGSDRSWSRTNSRYKKSSSSGSDISRSRTNSRYIKSSSSGRDRSWSPTNSRYKKSSSSGSDRSWSRTNSRYIKSSSSGSNRSWSRTNKRYKKSSSSGSDRSWSPTNSRYKKSSSSGSDRSRSPTNSRYIKSSSSGRDRSWSRTNSRYIKSSSSGSDRSWSPTNSRYIKSSSSGSNRSWSRTNNRYIKSSSSGSDGLWSGTNSRYIECSSSGSDSEI